MQTDDVEVRVCTLDRGWETIGSGRYRGVWPELGTLTSDKWGFKTAQLALHRPPGAVWPDLLTWTPIEIDVAGELVWDGRAREVKDQDGRERSLQVEAVGWQDHLDDDQFEQLFVHGNLTAWRDARSFATVPLTVCKTNGQAQVGDGAIVIGFGNGASVAVGDAVAVILDLGPLRSARKAVIDWANAGMAGFRSLRMYGSNDPASLTGGELGGGVDPSTATGPSFSATFTAPYRYLTLLTISTGGATTETADRLVRITGIRVFGEQGYESGGQSAMTGDVPVRAALARAPLLDQDTSEIDTPTWAIPEMTPDGSRSPREWISGTLTYYDWIAQLGLRRRLRFRARPTTAVAVEVGAWSGSDNVDVVTNGDEIYNVCRIEAEGPDGSPIRVERSAAELPGAVLIPSSDVVVTNPSATANTTGWAVTAGTLTRDTTAFNTAPASIKIVPPVSGFGLATYTGFSGTWRAGVLYVLQVMCNSGIGRLEFGSGTDFSTRARGAGGWGMVLIPWIPRTTVTSAFLRVSPWLSSIYVDDIAVWTAAPTLVDRWGFRRSKTIQSPARLNDTAAQVLADRFLTEHLSPQLKGSREVIGFGGCRRPNGEPLHPSRLLSMTMQRMRMLDRIDPLTGAIGLAGTMIDASYDHPKRATAVTLDNQRTNFDALVARMATMQGRG